MAFFVKIQRAFIFLFNFFYLTKKLYKKILMSLRKAPNLGLSYRTPEGLLKTSKILSNSSEKSYHLKPTDYFDERAFHQSDSFSQNFKKSYNNAFEYPEFFKNKNESQTQQDSQLFRTNTPPTNQEFFQKFAKNLEIYKVETRTDQTNKDMRNFAYVRHQYENDALFFKEEFENNPLLIQERNRVFSTQALINFIFTVITGIFSFCFAKILFKLFAKEYNDRLPNNQWSDFLFFLVLIILLFIRSLRFTSKFFLFFFHF